MQPKSFKKYYMRQPCVKKPWKTQVLEPVSI
jgi:hypothetical protein